MIIDNVEIAASGFKPAHDELKNYVEYVKARVPNVERIHVVLCQDGCVDLKYTAHEFPFERIRRITGYLTGDLTTWNNAKKSEEHDRVKHL